MALVCVMTLIGVSYGPFVSYDSDWLAGLLGWLAGWLAGWLKICSGNSWAGSWGNPAGPRAVPGFKLLYKNPLEVPKGIPS